MKKPRIFIFLMLLISSCTNSELELRNIAIAENASIDIPVMMDTTSKLHPSALFQFHNPRKEIYTIIIKESAKNFESNYQEFGFYDSSVSVLKNYAKLLISTMEAEGLKSSFIDSLSDEKSLYYLCEGKVGNIAYPLTYLCAYRQLDDQIYAINSWTLSNKFEKNKSMFIEIVKSLKNK